MDKIKLANKLIGKGMPCSIVTEARINHNSNSSVANQIIDAAKKAEADAVKFQTLRGEDVLTENAENPKYQSISW